MDHVLRLHGLIRDAGYVICDPALNIVESDCIRPLGTVYQITGLTVLPVYIGDAVTVDEHIHDQLLYKGKFHKLRISEYLLQRVGYNIPLFILDMDRQRSD